MNTFSVVGIKRLFIGSIMAFLSACQTIPLSQVSQFGTATITLGESARKTLDLANKASIDRNLYDIASNPGNGPTNAMYEGLFSGQSGSPEGEIKAKRLRLRLSALQSLMSYGKALKALAETDLTDDLNEAATELNGSLVDLRKTYNKATGKDLPVTDGDIAIISTAVNAIGKAVVEDNRQNAIRVILDKTDPSISLLTEVISEDFGRGTDISQYVSESLSNVRGSIQTAYNIERIKPGTSFDTRIDMLDKARQVYNVEQGIPELFDDLSEGIKSVSEAHTALALAAKDKEHKLIEEGKAASAIGKIASYANSVYSFYKSLDNGK